MSSSNVQDRGRGRDTSAERAQEPTSARGLSPLTGSEHLYAVNRTDRQYKLELVQEPEIGLAAGLEEGAFGRMPLQPAYVLQLRVFTGDRELSQDEYADEIPLFICRAKIFERDDPESEGQPEIQREADVVSRIGEDHQVSTMVGHTVTTAMATTDLEGRPAVLFGFGDISVRIPGEFRIRFSLGQVLDGAPLIDHVMSGILSIYEEDEFTLPPNKADTALSRHLRTRGMSLFHPIQPQSQ